MTEAMAIPTSGATIKDYEAIAKDYKITEFIKGDIIVTPPPTVKHQLIVSKLLAQLSLVIKTDQSVVLSAPIGLILPDNNVLEPDVLVLNKLDELTLEGNYIVEPPILVVEVLSPSTRHRDWGIKKQLYEAFGIAEYWIIDPKSLEVSQFTLKDGSYHLKSKTDLKEGKVTCLTIKNFKF